MDNQNPFTIELEHFFERINDIASLTKRVKSYLIDHKNTIVESFNGLESNLFENEYPIMASSLIIEDLTNSEYNIHYPTGAISSLYYRDLDFH